MDFACLIHVMGKLKLVILKKITNRNKLPQVYKPLPLSAIRWTPLSHLKLILHWDHILLIKMLLCVYLKHWCLQPTK